MQLFERTLTDQQRLTFSGKQLEEDRTLLTSAIHGEKQVFPLCSHECILLLTNSFTLNQLPCIVGNQQLRASPDCIVNLSRGPLLFIPVMSAGPASVELASQECRGGPSGFASAGRSAVSSNTCLPRGCAEAATQAQLCILISRAAAAQRLGTSAWRTCMASRQP